MNLMGFLNSQLGPRLGIFLARFLKENQAHRLSDFLVNRIASVHPNKPPIRGLRSNLAVVYGLPFHSPRLDELLALTLKNFGHSLADWYLSMSRGPQNVLSRCHIDENIERYVWQSIRNSRGVMLVGAHLSGFNIFLMVLGARKVPVQVLTASNPTGSYVIDNQLRRKFGVRITPISPQSLKESIRTLNQAGIVLTAVDWPDPGGEELFFFGRKARLPVGHIRLAIKTNANLVVGSCRSSAGGGYHVTGIPVYRDKNGTSTGIQMAQRVISVLEGHIRAQPQDWFMFHPLWDHQVLR